MQASDLRHIISFQSATTSSDGEGGRTASTWVTDKTCRAKIIAQGSDVEYRDGQTVGFKRYLITCRYQQDYVITKKTRILWVNHGKNRYLTPAVGVNADSLEKWVTFEATEKI